MAEFICCRRDVGLHHEPLRWRLPGDNFDEIRKINFAEPQRDDLTVHVMGGCQMHKRTSDAALIVTSLSEGRKPWVVTPIFPRPWVPTRSNYLLLAPKVTTRNLRSNQKPFAQSPARRCTAIRYLFGIECFGKSKARSEVTQSEFDCLNKKTALILSRRARPC